MPLIPSSPEWDAYVQQRRRDAVPEWDRWHRNGADIRQIDAHAMFDCESTSWNSRPWTIVRTRTDASLSDGIDHILSGEYSETHRAIADDWETLAAWIEERPIAVDKLFVKMALTPSTIWCQDFVVVLTEQLADLFFAPPNMDTTDIYAWLDLFRLPDTATSRRDLAKFIRGGTIRPLRHMPSWTNVVALQHLIDCNIDVRRAAVAKPRDPVVATTPSLAIPRRKDALTRDAISDGRVRTTYRTSSQIRLPNRGAGFTDGGLSVVDDGRHAIATVTDRDPESTLTWWTVTVQTSPDPFKDSRGFTPDDVSRSVPLDVTLLAHAGPGRHTVEP